MRLQFAVVAASLCPVVAPAVAAEEAEHLSPIVVTAVRGAETASESLAAITVITRDDIDRLQPQSLPELLVGLPGVSLSSNGGPGKSSTLFLRGSNGDHVVVLLDGIKLGSATAGSTALEQIPVDQIDHIEIVRGPRSSLYGSEAIGGVIQIFSKRGVAGTALTPSFAIGAGNLGSRKAQLGARGGVGARGWYSASLSALSTDNVDTRPAGGENDKDGYRNGAATLAAGWNFANGAEWSVNALRVDGRNEYDGSTTNESKNTQQMLGSRLRFAPLKPWLVTLTGGQSQDRSENYHDPEVLSDGVLTDNRGAINTRRSQLGWQNDLELTREQILSAGIDFIRDRVGGDIDYAEKQRDNTGLYGQYRGGFGKLELQGSVRHDDNEQFGTHTTGGTALGYDLADALHLALNYGTAFKAPSFNDLYYPSYGIPDLQPEKSRSVEASVSGSDRSAAGLWNWSLNGYRTTIDNLIAYNPAIFGPENLGKAQISGVELQLGVVYEALRVQTAYNWLNPESRQAGNNKGNDLPRRARNTARLDLDYAWSRVALGGTLYGAGRRYNEVGNTNRLDGYATFDLRASIGLLPSWALDLKAANLLDKDYTTVKDYALPGRTWFATLRYTPGAR